MTDHRNLSSPLESTAFACSRSNITASLVERDSELRKLSHEVATLRLKVAAPEQHICAPNPQSAARDSDESIAIARKEKEGTKMGRNGGYSNRIKTAGPKIVVDRKERQADRDSDQQPDTTLEDNQELESTDKDDGLEGARPHSRSVVWGEEEERDLVCSTGGAEGGGDGVARIGFVSPISRNRRRPLPGRDGRDDGARRAGRGLEDEGDRTPPQPEVVDVILDKYMVCCFLVVLDYVSFSNVWLEGEERGRETPEYKNVLKHG